MLRNANDTSKRLFLLLLLTLTASVLLALEADLRGGPSYNDNARSITVVADRHESADYDDWNTYHNAKYRFSFRYPPDWRIIERDKGLEDDIERSTVWVRSPHNPRVDSVLGRTDYVISVNVLSVDPAFHFLWSNRMVELARSSNWTNLPATATILSEDSNAQKVVLWNIYSDPQSFLGLVVTKQETFQIGPSLGMTSPNTDDDVQAFEGIMGTFTLELEP